MTPFEWLLIGHLIGDWAFQNDWMVRHKQSRLFNRAVFIHCGVYTFVMLLFLWIAASKPLSISQYLLFGLIIYISHWLIDATNAAARWMHVLQQSDQLFVRIVVDQIFHIFILALLVELFL